MTPSAEAAVPGGLAAGAELVAFWFQPSASDSYDSLIRLSADDYVYAYCISASDGLLATTGVRYMLTGASTIVLPSIFIIFA